MAETLKIYSFDSDNRITVKFSDKNLPRYARYGDLYVVDGLSLIHI